MSEVKSLSLNEEQIQLFHLTHLSPLSLTSVAPMWHLCLLHHKELSSVLPTLFLEESCTSVSSGIRGYVSLKSLLSPFGTQ